MRVSTNSWSSSTNDIKETVLPVASPGKEMNFKPVLLSQSKTWRSLLSRTVQASGIMNPITVVDLFRLLVYDEMDSVDNKRERERFDDIYLASTK